MKCLFSARYSPVMLLGVWIWLSLAACSAQHIESPAFHQGLTGADGQLKVAATSLDLPGKGEVVSITAGGQPFAVVNLEGQPKPFIFPLFGPGGVPVTRSFPMQKAPDEEADHPHHVSFWFAHGDVDGYDFWHGSDRGEGQVLGGPWSMVEAQDEVTLSAPYLWMTDAGPLLQETRRLTFRAHENLRVIDVEITLRPAGDETVTFGDTKEGSFAMRLHPALRLDGKVASGTIQNAAGDRDAATWGKRAAWIDYSGVIEGKTVGVAILDHTKNLRHPTWWHARGYGLVAANPFGVHHFESKPAGTGDFVLHPGAELRLNYRVLLHAGKWTSTELDRAWADFCAQVPRN